MDMAKSYAFEELVLVWTFQALGETTGYGTRQALESRSTVRLITFDWSVENALVSDRFTVDTREYLANYDASLSTSKSKLHLEWRVICE